MSSLVVPNAGLNNHHVALPVYLHGEEQVEKKRKEVAAESSESSSIGAASSEDEGSRQEGKSKSFANLSDAATASAKDIAKPENPFNKRRRLLMISNIRSASYTSLSSRDHTVKESDEE
ncbi:hypothetical protein C4D60_Mb05t12880 [Musa balbisiana]|uniref:Uncharacterized protein n=1 Tax=Musa balbisiana TaxID=52838 RepID=A0A4S8JVR1_MUSBA|nr:hypothetical protein C4D60_Mb05t12880 [Musa balbisiana]